MSAQEPVSEVAEQIEVPALPLPPNAEEDIKEIQEAIENSPYKLTPKFVEYMRLYNDPNSPTFGNGTQSIIKAYGLDPEKQYHVARSMAAQNFAKLSVIMQDYAERKGYTLQRLADVAYLQALKGNTAWYDRYKEMLGMSRQNGVNINIQNNNTTNNVQNNIFNTDEKTIDDFNKEFKEYLESKK